MQGVLQGQLGKWQFLASQFTGCKLSPSTSSQEVCIRVSGVRSSVDREVKAKAVAAPTLAENRLVPRVEEKDGYWVVREEFRTGINVTEKVCVQCGAHIQ